MPEKWQDQRVLLHFEAVDWEATVFVNGKQLGEHRGGYDAFPFDITDALKPSGDQELIVKVFDPTTTAASPAANRASSPRACSYTTVDRHLADGLAGTGADGAHRAVKIVPDVDAPACGWR